MIERPFDEKGLRDLPDFFARPLLNLALNPTRTAAYTLRAGTPFGKSGERRANKFRDERKKARATAKQMRGDVWKALLHTPRKLRRKVDTLGLDIQEEFDDVQLNFQSGLQAGRLDLATFSRTSNIHAGRQAPSNIGKISLGTV